MCDARQLSKAPTVKDSVMWELNDDVLPGYVTNGCITQNFGQLVLVLKKLVYEAILINMYGVKFVAVLPWKLGRVIIVN